MPNVSNLNVFERSHRLTLSVYRTTAAFPSSKRFGLTSQMRRSAASVPSNLFEGGGRNSDREFARFVAIAQGSMAELSYQIRLANDLGYLDAPRADDLRTECAELGRMLHGLRRTLLAANS